MKEEYQREIKLSALFCLHWFISCFSPQAKPILFYQYLVKPIMETSVSSSIKSSEDI